MNGTVHTDSDAQLAAAKESAQRVLGTWEAKSPELKDALVGMPRDCVVDLMAMTFLDGVKYGAQAMFAGVFEALPDEEVGK